MRIAAVVLLFTAACKPPPGPIAQPVAPEALCAGKPDRPVSVRRLKGTFAGVEIGDYQHLRIRDEQGQEHSFFVRPDTHPALAYFLVAHRGKPVRVEAEVVDSCIWEAGGYQRIERITSAEIEGVRHADWWTRVRGDAARVKALGQEYEKLEEAAAPKP